MLGLKLINVGKGAPGVPMVECKFLGENIGEH